MKPYRVQVEVTTTYTVEVHAGDEQLAGERAWRMDSDEVEATGSAEKTEVTSVDQCIEEIQRESGE